MARYYYSGARDTVEQAKRIDFSWLRKNDYFVGYRSGNINWSINGEPTGNIDLKVDIDPENPHIKFTYKVRKHGSEEWKDMDFSFRLESLPCKFGGKKWFYICGLYVDGKYCGRRARVVYQAGDYFGCRKCANLSYESCNESKRFKYGSWRIFMNETKSEEYYKKNVKRHYYRGRPTKKYQRYLNISNNYSERDFHELQMELLSLKNK